MDVLDKILFLMELIVEHVSIRIQFGLMMLVVSSFFVVWFMLSPTCSDCDPVRVLAVGDGQFPA